MVVGGGIDAEFGEAGERALAGFGAEKGERGFRDGGADIAGDRVRFELGVFFFRVGAGVGEKLG